MKSLKKHNKILFSMAKRLGSRRKLKKIKKIHAKASKIYEFYIRDRYISASISSLYIENKLYERI